MQTKASSAGPEGGNGAHLAQPLLEQHGKEIQDFQSTVRLPNGLDEELCRKSIQSLNHLLADTLTLRDLYKKHHWQVSGPTFYQLHLLFDKHFEAQLDLVDALAERVQMLGGIAIAMAPDVAETTCIPRPPRGREEVPVQIARLLEAHETVLKEAHRAAHEADASGDDGTADLLISQVIRTNEMQVWFLAEHLVDAPLVRGE
jgi:starvation-inducible DNA-binding protein